MQTEMHTLVTVAGVQSVLVLTPVPCKTSLFSCSMCTYWSYFQTLFQGHNVTRDWVRRDRQTRLFCVLHNTAQQLSFFSSRHRIIYVMQLKYRHAHECQKMWTVTLFLKLQDTRARHVLEVATPQTLKKWFYCCNNLFPPSGPVHNLFPPK